MKWYRIEYNAGNSESSIIGQYGRDLSEVLNAPDCPKFLKFENTCYYSRLTGKYEMYESWDSKNENTLWVNSASITAVREIKDDLLVNPLAGEHTAFPSDGITLVVPKQFVDSLSEERNSELLERLEAIKKEKAVRLQYLGTIQVSIQSLLHPNEFIISQFGKAVVRKKVEGDLGDAVLDELLVFLNRYDS